ncbi:MAG: hypothetical protein MUF22_05655 [Chitinispirillaceae bacterium]|jgi:hypothetical protein|nr:hypothetical protein [Chitinispirillaceae bacterium]
MSDAGNVIVAVSNTVQMDKHQDTAHRSPVINQDQNALAAREEFERRVLMPVEPDHVDGKIIDPQARREEDARKRKKKQTAHKENRASGNRSGGSDARFIDIEA